jgi:hypothetical protein
MSCKKGVNVYKQLQIAYFTFGQLCYSEHTHLSGLSFPLFSNVNFLRSAVGRSRGQQAVIEACLLSFSILCFSEAIYAL